MFHFNSSAAGNKNISRSLPTTTGHNNINERPKNHSENQDLLNQDRVRADRTSFRIKSKIRSPNQGRVKLNSIIRRIRSLMEYCVNALNEASSTSCSNRFDPQTFEGRVWLLGRQYELPWDAEKLVIDVKSKIWITYRRDFLPIDDQNQYTTDRGFGCMIRCGQMVLANALIYKNLGRDWQWDPSGLAQNPTMYIDILKLFQDKISSPYSIHNIVRLGQREGKNIGEWFGPNTIAQTLRRQANLLTKNQSTPEALLISIDTALDNIVVIDEVKSKLKSSRSSATKSPPKESDEQTELESTSENREIESSGTESYWIPGILFIQLRLGLTKINPLYFNALRKTFQFKHSLGIIGGRPNHALYLIGYTQDDIVYLDPHNTQRHIDFDQPNQASLESQDTFPGWMSGNSVGSIDASYHCDCVEKMPLEKLDPSLALCFYFHTEQEFDKWCELSDELLIKSEQAPMFEITKSRPSDWSSEEIDWMPEVE